MKLGDIIERNEYGLHKYTMPRNNQVAKVIKTLDHVMHDSDEMECDIIIAVAVEKEVIKTFAANSNYYKKVKISNKIIPLNKGVK